MDNYISELRSIRAGRANPHILDKVVADYYGTPTPINNMANISVPEARLLVIAPWDKSQLKNIEKPFLPQISASIPTMTVKLSASFSPSLRRSADVPPSKKPKTLSKKQKSLCATHVVKLSTSSKNPKSFHDYRGRFEKLHGRYR